jgi:hypothetical protein
MLLENNDIALGIYIIFMIGALAISYYLAATAIKKTGLFGAQTFIAAAINLFLGIMGILGWLFFSWGVNEFLFLGGLMLGAGLLVVSEVILIIALFAKRKQLLGVYKDSLNNHS